MLQNSSNKSLVFYLILFSLVGSFLTSSILISFSQIVPDSSDNVWFLRMTILLQDLLVMFLPAYSVFKFSMGKPIYMLGMKKSASMWRMLLFTMLIYIVSLPSVSIMTQLNNSIVFPEFLSGLEAKFKQMEESAKAVTDTFLSGTSAFDIFINILIVAVAAAIVEEVFFRGALQKLLSSWFKNGHMAVWVTAFIFSAIHLQFYGFVPRLFMGAVLGYLFYYSKNLWVPIFYHFVNNAFVVVSNYSWGGSSFFEEMEKGSVAWYSWIILIVSLYLTYILFRKFRKYITPSH